MARYPVFNPLVEGLEFADVHKVEVEVDGKKHLFDVTIQKVIGYIEAPVGTEAKVTYYDRDNNPSPAATIITGPEGPPMAEKPFAGNAFMFKHNGLEIVGRFHTGHYVDGNIAIELFGHDAMHGWEKYTTLSSNPDKSQMAVALQTTEFVLKSWSENEGLAKQFIEMGLFVITREVENYSRYIPLALILKPTAMYFKLTGESEEEVLRSGQCRKAYGSHSPDEGGFLDRLSGLKTVHMDLPKR